jgi:hypothetical protein
MDSFCVARRLLLKGCSSRRQRDKRTRFSEFLRPSEAGRMPIFYCSYGSLVAMYVREERIQNDRTGIAQSLEFKSLHAAINWYAGMP